VVAAVERKEVNSSKKVEIGSECGVCGKVINIEDRE